MNFLVFQRWWQYQKERFPLAPYSLLIAAMCYAASSQGIFHWVNFCALYLQVFFTFALLRIADEFKDYKDDCAYRPYRPVPRGLISRKELAVAGVLLAASQWALSFTLHNTWFLLLWWLYFLLMSAEFFVAAFLKARPVLYLVSHMLIMFLFAAFLARAFAPLSANYWPFAALCFLAGLLLEIGRKIRLEPEEESGVDTYSKLWGRIGAIRVWFGVTLLLALLVTFQNSVAGAGYFLFCLFNAIIFMKPIKAKYFEALSSFWLLTLFIVWGYVV